MQRCGGWVPGQKLYDIWASVYCWKVLVQSSGPDHRVSESYFLSCVPGWTQLGEHMSVTCINTVWPRVGTWWLFTLRPMGVLLMLIQSRGREWSETRDAGRTWGALIVSTLSLIQNINAEAVERPAGGDWSGCSHRKMIWGEADSVYWDGWLGRGRGVLFSISFPGKSFFLENMTPLHIKDGCSSWQLPERAGLVCPLFRWARDLGQRRGLSHLPKGTGSVVGTWAPTLADLTIGSGFSCLLC